MSSETPNVGNKPPIPKPAKKIPAINIEKRGDRLYEVDHLHKWFAISSLLLFLFTVGMVLLAKLRTPTTDTILIFVGFPIFALLWLVNSIVMIRQGWNGPGHIFRKTPAGKQGKGKRRPKASTRAPNGPI